VPSGKDGSGDVGLIPTLVAVRRKCISMRVNLNRLFPLIIGAMLAGACQSGADRIAQEMGQVLDSLQIIYAPDTRITWWKPEIKVSGRVPAIEGEVGDVTAFEAIVNEFGRRYPGIVLNLLLLPEERSERSVNGLVGISVANIRSSPGHRSELSTQALLGTPVRILKEEKGWYLVQTPNRYLGWVDHAAVVELSPLVLDSIRALEKIVFTSQYGSAFHHPDPGSGTVGDMVAGCILFILSSQDGYHEIIYPDGVRAWVLQEEVAGASEFFSMDPSGEEVAVAALRYNGIPYLWGGTSSKAADCSGFSSMVYFINGTLIMRDANQQSWHGKVVTTEYEMEELLPGDLLFYGRKATDTEQEHVSHVAIYLGDAEFIHASETLGKVGISSMDSTREHYLPDYRRLFVRAVRVLEQEDEGIQKVQENSFYMEIL
jgi:cell wall-associated NlpC family hydrolase